MHPSDLQVFFLALLALFLVGAALDFWLLRLLRIDHTDTWRSLGSPTLVTGNSLRSMHAVRTFIAEGRHRRLNDRRIDRIVRLRTAFTMIYRAVLVAALAVVVWSIYRARMAL
jgi:hypothetical protein